MTTARNRGRSNRNERGDTTRRRERKRALLERDGDGVTAKCWECGTPVTAATLHADRIVPGEFGGTYDLANLRCHCPGCSARQGQRRTVEILKARKALRDKDNNW